MPSSPDHEHGRSSEIPEPQPPEHTLRSPRDSPSSSIPEFDTSISPPSFGSKTTLSRSETRLPNTPPTSSISKSRSRSGLRKQSRDRSSASSRDTSPSIPLSDSNQECRQTIVRSFAPRVAVYASPDTEAFVRQKGFRGGLYTLLRPYGERLQGRVIIRDSVGSSRGWDDFGVRFINAQELQRSSARHVEGGPTDLENRGLPNGSQNLSEHRKQSRSDDFTAVIDRLLSQQLHTENTIVDSYKGDYSDYGGRSYEPLPAGLPLYPFYLRKLLSSAPIVPYETFSHPVACMITVSSRHPAPIEALRQLYENTGHGFNKTPTWISTEYLRYYVLIHDEENDDITKSTALFDLMKRHFGLHCHLLRLRSSQCVQTDDDSTRVPSSEWLSAEEEINQIRSRDYTIDIEDSEKYILESDATAIRALLREMVAQSIVPFMESRIMTWNDQVASRRRGISGRFMSLSKRWTGFGSSKAAASGPSGASTASGSNYDVQRGFYPPETSEATMRQLADYAFLLRDWKLAHSTYDFLRTEFSHDKAWNYHAAVNEMVAITSLLMSQTYNLTYKMEAIDQMLDTAAYSYLTRCSMPSYVVRCFTLAMELLKNRGTLAADDAARLGGKLLDFGILDPVAQAMTSERIADCYMSRASVIAPNAGTRRRQAALWNILSADSWIRLDNPVQARLCLTEASALYRLRDQQIDGPPFPSMQGFWQKLDRALGEADSPQSLVDTGVGADHLEYSTIEETEQLSAFTRPVNAEVIDTEGFTPQDASRPHPNASYDTPLQSNSFE